MPKEWEVAKIVLIYKKSNSRESDNYSDTTLLNTTAKIYELISKTLRPIIEYKYIEFVDLEKVFDSIPNRSKR